MIISRENIVISINQKPSFQNPSITIWGFPLNEEILLESEWDEVNINKVHGYFFAVKECDAQIEMVNDILGGFRIYYSFINDKIVITDDYNLLEDKIGNKLTINMEQYDYWKNHRFTLDNNTLYNEIFKVSPASFITYKSCKLSICSYFQNHDNTPDYKQYLRKNRAIIEEQLQLAYRKYSTSRFILFYSGGTDSTFLLCSLKKLKIPFTCVVIRYLPQWSVAEKDFIKAINRLHLFGIEDYEIIEADLNIAYNDFIDVAKQEMLFDRHISVHFYETYRRVAERFGSDIVVINGQSADSILGFGPTDISKGFFIQRCVLYSNKLTNIFWSIFVKILLGKQYRMPWTKEQKLMAMLDEHNYWFVLNQRCQYIKMLKDKINNNNFARLYSFYSKRMYAKIISFLQGPDNQIVIKSANHFGINKIIMPFTSPEFIYNVIKYKSDWKEIFVGKYFVRDILEEMIADGQISKPEQLSYENPANDFDMEAFENRILQSYNQYLKSKIDIL